VFENVSKVWKYRKHFGIPRKTGFQGSLYLSRESLGNSIFQLPQKQTEYMHERGIAGVTQQ
jgi:hypothetical protein